MDRPTVDNTIIVSAAAYEKPHEAVAVTSKAFRYAGLPVRYLRWGSTWVDYYHAKIIPIIDNIDQWISEGVRHLIWIDATDSIPLASWTEIVNRYAEKIAPANRMTFAADYHRPYHCNEPWLKKMLDSTDQCGAEKGYPCAGLFAGPLEIIKQVTDLTTDISHDRNRLHKKYPYYQLLTNKKFIETRNDQFLFHLGFIENPSLFKIDYEKQLFSNYLGGNRPDEARKPHPDAWYSIGDALIVHGPTLKQGRVNFNWFDQYTR